MNITHTWLKEKGACEEGTQWFLNQTKVVHTEVIKSLIKEVQFNWANWIITKLMTKTQNVQYACYSAKQSLHLFEKLYPNDKRPRQAIVAVYKWAKNPTEENRSAAMSAEAAARSAAWSAAMSAESAAWSAAMSAEAAARSAAESAEAAARSAAWSAESAAWSAARSAESAAWSAARSAAWSAARSAESAAWRKILKYGLRLIKGLN
jgi:hypothetical protein